MKTYQKFGLALAISGLAVLLGSPLLPGQTNQGAVRADGLSGTPAVPATHTSSHASGGSDPIKLDDLAAPDDNTDLNASTTKHGLLPKLSNVATEFLTGIGTWSTVTTGASAQDVIDIVWLKKFFSDASLLPATERIAASLATFPVPAGTPVGTFTRKTGVAEFTTTTTGIAYYDLGALRTEVLLVAMDVQLNTTNTGTIALALSSGVPTDASPDGYYFFQVSAGGTNPGFAVNKRAAGAFTVLGSIASSLPAPITAATVPEDHGPISMALYYNDTTGALKAFVRQTGSWRIVVDTTDSTYTTMRYASLRGNLGAAGTGVLRMGLPFVAYSN